MLGVTQGRREGGGRASSSGLSFLRWEITCEKQVGATWQSHICWWGQMWERAHHLRTWPGGRAGWQQDSLRGSEVVEIALCGP